MKCNCVQCSFSAFLSLFYPHSSFFFVCISPQKNNEFSINSWGKSRSVALKLGAAKACSAGDEVAGVIGSGSSVWGWGTVRGEAVELGISVFLLANHLKPKMCGFTH